MDVFPTFLKSRNVPVGYVLCYLLACMLVSVCRYMCLSFCLYVCLSVSRSVLCRQKTKDSEWEECTGSNDLESSCPCFHFNHSANKSITEALHIYGSFGQAFNLGSRISQDNTSARVIFELYFSF